MSRISPAFGVFGHGAVKRESADGEGNDVGQDDAEESADESDGEGLSQKLKEDVSPARAQRFLDADLARALSDGDEHDVHQADAADAERERADERQQNLEADGDDLELVHLHHKVKDHQGAAVGGIEFVLRRNDVAHGLLNPLIVVGLVIEPDGVEVVSVLEIAHGGEGNVHNAIDIVVARLHLGSENANDFKADAVEANVFAQSIASREKFFFGFGANDSDPRALDLILGIVEAPLLEAQRADAESVGVFAIDAHGVGASVVLHGRILLATGSDVCDLRDVAGEQVDVIQREAGWRTRLLAARLHRGAAGDHDDQLGPEVSENVGASAAEAIPVSQQHDDGGDTPGHAQHGERGAAPVVAHGVVGFLEQVAHHRAFVIRDLKL